MDWNVILVQPIQSLLTQVMGFLPNFLGALLILLVGWVIAKTIERVVGNVLKAIQLDKLADRLQLSDVLAKGGIKRKLSEVVSAIIYWLVILAIVIAALNALQLTIAAQLLEQVVTFLPNVVASIFILVVGILSASFLATTVRTAAGNAGVSQSQLLGEAVQAVVVIFSVVAALKQLGIQFVGEAFLIILAAVSFGTALAFGIGCKDIAGRWVGDLVEQLSSRKR